MSLKNKAAVVTGGGSGIGRAISLQLAQDGAAVSVWDLSGDSAEQTVAMIVKAGGRAIACVGDASAKSDIAHAAQLTRQAFGPISILVNNAGISSFTPFMDISEEMIDRIMAINIKGPMLCCQEIIPDMLKSGWGRIINISSSSAQTGAPMMCHYSASKGGVIAFTKSLALELAAKGITVNNIPPGFVDTPMLRKSPVDIEKQIAASPMKRAGSPEDIATACAFLASEQAGYITGQTLGVNGGRVMP
jgi:2-hydroxycyclohexanecarboxyl-CoA dehydrogenase